MKNTLLRRTVFSILVHCACALLGIYLPIATQAAEVVVNTSFGNGADVEVRKNANETLNKHDSGHGDHPDLNVRHDPTPGRERNEVVLLRFDLSEISPRQIEYARLELTAFSSFHKNSLIVYGLKHTANGHGWDENTVKFSTAPGLEWDADDLSSRGLMEADTIKLGSLNIPRPEQGMVVSFTSESLIDFLRDPAWKRRTEAANSVTLILMLGKPSRGQRRFCSKEYADGFASAPRLVIVTP